MKADKECFLCCRKKAGQLVREYGIPVHKQEEIMKDIDSIIDEDCGLSAPALMADVMRLLETKLKVSDIYKEAKRKYNKLLLDREEQLWTEIISAKDLFLEGLRYAVTGNYIDFGAMQEVREDKLDELLRGRENISLDSRETSMLRKDLEKARRLAYITDNAGEIVLDKLFIRVLDKMYPDMEITVIVRGTPVLNDATMEDAKCAGMEQYAKVINNGCHAAGTPMDAISKEARSRIKDADLCIAKGQGNFESLRESGENVYYLFLCKCDLFVKKFGVERFAPVLANEKRIVQYT